MCKGDYSVLSLCRRGVEPSALEEGLALVGMWQDSITTGEKGKG